MIWAFAIPALLIAPIWQANTTIEPSPAGLHVIIEREFIYLAATNTSRLEQWLAGDKTYEKRGDQVSIIRKDLGVRWILDVARKSYSERALKNAEEDQESSTTEDQILVYIHELFLW
jgi:hypothetical protein